FLFLFLQRLGIDKGLVELGYPTQASLDRRSCVIDVIAVKAEAHLQTEGIPRTQSDVFYSFLLSCVKERIPYARCLVAANIELESACAGIARIGDNDIVDTGKHALSEM